MQWIETSNIGGLAAAQILPPDSASPAYIGAYAVSDGVFFNPMLSNDNDSLVLTPSDSGDNSLT